MHESRLWESPVLQSVLPIVEASEHVRISEDEIRRVARWMAYEEFAPIGSGGPGPFDVGADPDRITDFTMLVNTLNFAFTDFRTSVKFETEYRGATYVDSEAMVACIHRAIGAGEPLLTGEWAARATRDDLARIFRGTIEMPMLDERAEILNRVGAVLYGRGIDRVVPVGGSRLQVLRLVNDLIAAPWLEHAGVTDLGALLDAGLCVTVNSDDPAYFGGYMNENLVKTFAATGMTAQQAYQLAANSFEASFITHTQRQQWMHQLKVCFERFVEHDN